MSEFIVAKLCVILRSHLIVVSKLPYNRVATRALYKKRNAVVICTSPVYL